MRAECEHIIRPWQLEHLLRRRAEIRLRRIMELLLRRVQLPLRRVVELPLGTTAKYRAHHCLRLFRSGSQYPVVEVIHYASLTPSQVVEESLLAYKKARDRNSLL
jgi:hypothetical protein